METTPLIIEINHDYSRTMNKIIFDKYLEDNNEISDQMFPKNLCLPQNPDLTREIPYYGMMPLERHKGAKLVWMYTPDKIFYEDPKNFTETFKDFCFSSLYIKEEVICAI